MLAIVAERINVPPRIAVSRDIDGKIGCAGSDYARIHCVFPEIVAGAKNTIDLYIGECLYY